MYHSVRIRSLAVVHFDGVEKGKRAHPMCTYRTAFPEGDSGMFSQVLELYHPANARGSFVIHLDRADAVFMNGHVLYDLITDVAADGYNGSPNCFHGDRLTACVISLGSKVANFEPIKPATYQLGLQIDADQLDLIMSTEELVLQTIDFFASRVMPMQAVSLNQQVWLDKQVINNFLVMGICLTLIPLPAHNPDAVQSTSPLDLALQDRLMDESIILLSTEISLSANLPYLRLSSRSNSVALCGLCSIMDSLQRYSGGNNQLWEYYIEHKLSPHSAQYSN